MLLFSKQIFNLSLNLQRSECPVSSTSVAFNAVHLLKTGNNKRRCRVFCWYNGNNMAFFRFILYLVFY